jgi:hypothetical protein
MPKKRKKRFVEPSQYRLFNKKRFKCRSTHQTRSNAEKWGKKYVTKYGDTNYRIVKFRSRTGIRFALYTHNPKAMWVKKR